ncbi:Uu.00g059470.m01.CDS01 [Anthostomella pinea]|uniref:Uu.00g059470.m01.CDS01 n=1 Tax=Anthostomella pinea TaxID=933095 RepID=A0AAI8VT91_9PEZI|nr:Uu.00g059470.m01.CDS01 [Anthostomella pinea]
MRSSILLASASLLSGLHALAGSWGVSDQGGPGWDDEYSICDKYTTSILGENTLVNQALLMTLFGKRINQMPYFNGELASSNLKEDIGHGVAIIWLDGGGPAALRQNLTAFTQDSNQWRFFTHLHEYFAYLLGCSLYGSVADLYSGSTDIDFEEQYTNTQFVLSGASLGFDQAAQKYIVQVLNWLFSHRCSPPMSVPKWAPPALQAMCTDAACELYAPVVQPRFVSNGSIYDEQAQPPNQQGDDWDDKNGDGGDDENGDSWQAENGDHWEGKGPRE